MNHKIKEWASFDEFIIVANEECDWLVLRSFEYLPNSLFENDKDVDVLCRDIERFVHIMGLTKRANGIGAYQVVISGKMVPFDVRFLGDNYYDKLWQHNMLESKIYTSNGVPRMNNENYFYSLIYHSKIQEIEVKEGYKERFLVLAKALNINDFKLSSVNNDKYVASLLSHFMEENNYFYVEPLDKYIPKNKVFLEKLSEKVLLKGRFYKLPSYMVVEEYIPNILYRLTPRFIKNYTKKVLVHVFK